MTIRHTLAPGLWLALLAATTCAQQPPAQSAPTTQPQQPTAKPAAPPTIKTHLKVGDTAPDFTLPNTKGELVKLGDFRGKKNVVLAFYILAFTGG